MNDNFFKTIAYRRKKYKDALIPINQAKQNRLKVQADSIKTMGILPNDKEAVMGISNNFSSPVLVTNFFGEREEPTRIRALKIKSKYQDLTNKEIEFLQNYQYMNEKQEERDKRAVLNESYRIGKRLIGLNGRNTVAVS